LHESIDLFPPPPSSARHDPAFETDWAAGRSLGVDDAVGYALRL
jgi:hypothetical protein